MFKEIEKELLSIISDEPIDIIANKPSLAIAKTMELIYKIKFEDIKRAYETNIGNVVNLTIIYDTKVKSIGFDLCPINGKLYHIIFVPESILSKDENNVVMLSRAIITYISCRVALIMDQYENILKRADEDNVFYSVMLQAMPVITCAIMRKIFSGPSLPKVIYMSLKDLMDTYKTLYTEEGVETILDLMNEEGLTVEMLLDNGFIYSIKDNDKYPGIWGPIKED